MTRRHFLLVLSLLAALTGGYLFYRVLRGYEFAELSDSLQRMSIGYVLLALALTVASFSCIAAMETLAVRYAERGEKTISWGRVARTAVAAIGVGHSLGLAALSSGAIRYRMYGRRGLGLTAIGEIVAFSGISVTLGLSFVGGLSLLWHGETLAGLLELSNRAIYAVGAAGLVLCAAYIIASALTPASVRIARHNLRLPSSHIVALQMLFSSLNYICVAGVLYAALAGFAAAPYPDVAALLVGSEASALIAHVPGGWGVLEYVFTANFDGSGVLTGLLLFRAIYYLLPLFICLGVWLIDEIAGRRASREDAPHLKAQNA